MSPNVIRIAVPYVNVDSAIGSLNLSIILIAMVAFIVTSIASGIAANYAYRSIADLAYATSKIADADGKARKKDLKALEMMNYMFHKFQRSLKNQFNC